MDAADLDLRLRIMRAFADTGEPPVIHDRAALGRLVDAHLLRLDDQGRIVMAFPFAAPGRGAPVRSGGRMWWSNCPWDAFGVIEALALDDASVESNGVTLTVRDGAVSPADAVFHVEVPARHWWDDIAYT